MDDGFINGSAARQYVYKDIICKNKHILLASYCFISMQNSLTLLFYIFLFIQDTYFRSKALFFSNPVPASPLRNISKGSFGMNWNKEENSTAAVLVLKAH